MYVSENHVLSILVVTHGDKEHQNICILLLSTEWITSSVTYEKNSLCLLYVETLSTHCNDETIEAWGPMIKTS